MSWRRKQWSWCARKHEEMENFFFVNVFMCEWGITRHKSIALCELNKTPSSKVFNVSCKQQKNATGMSNSVNCCALSENRWSVRPCSVRGTDCRFYTLKRWWRRLFSVTERVNEMDGLESVACQPWTSRLPKMAQPDLDYIGKAHLQYACRILEKLAFRYGTPAVCM